VEAWDETAWRALAAELAAWRAAGRAASLWWRDDDAATPHPGLDRLLALAGRAGVPLGLAVVPAGLTPEVTEAVRRAPAAVAVLQHGWAHTNHERPPAAGAGKLRPAECGSARSPATVLAELAAGRDRLAAAFGPRFLAVLVPPWNRIAPVVAAALPGAGYRALSAFGAADGRARIAGLRSLNCHADPIRWRTDRGFTGAAATLERLRAHLADRRAGRADRDEPTGLLTHHRDMDEPFWRFLEELLTRLPSTPGATLPSLPACVGAA
jgi:hypothetical protein